LKGFIAALIVLSLLLVLSISTLDKGIKRDKATYSECLGTEVVIGGDTLTVVDYSIWLQTFTLSNGTKVSEEFIVK
jgi:hypothetical protein